MRWLGFFELATLAALVFAVATSLAVAAVWPWLQPRLRRWHPSWAAYTALLAACAPTLLPALALALCLAPGLFGSDHCPLHVEHAHLCLHHPAVAQGALAAAVLAATAAATPLSLLRGALHLGRARRALARLAPLAGARLGRGVHLVATGTPLSLAVGAFRPHIVVSEGLVEALTPRELDAVLEHERCHVRRKDALRGLLARALSWPHLPRVRSALLAELRLAAERACDEGAATHTGDRLLVAEAILSVERLVRQRPPSAEAALASAFGESDVAPRVESLLADPTQAPRARGVLIASAAVGLLALAAADPLHHATEHLLRALLAPL